MRVVRAHRRNGASNTAQGPFIDRTTKFVLLHPFELPEIYSWTFLVDYGSHGNHVADFSCTAVNPSFPQTNFGCSGFDETNENETKAK